MEQKSNTPHINVDYFEDLTGDIDKGEKSDVAGVGQRIKELREQKGISIEDLSKLTGFATKKLQAIEDGIDQPQLGTVMKLSKSLDSAVGRLVSGVGTSLYSITKKNERKNITRSSKAKQNLYSYMSLAPEVKGRHMEALIVQLEENPEKDLSVHDGEEFIYVLEGVAKLVIGDDKYDLEPGDSAYYLSTTQHQICAKNGKATILAVLYE
ncbi:MAG: helix-turn-helix transcriptional regulator [Desulfobacterales bacterium]|nr:helix-turn-helix transcriptional regulator [Desulfobacterales bacterium]